MDKQKGLLSRRTLANQIVKGIQTDKHQQKSIENAIKRINELESVFWKNDYQHTRIQALEEQVDTLKLQVKQLQIKLEINK